eukprot:766324-Hanusia_phi.AAC.1
MLLVFLVFDVPEAPTPVQTTSLITSCVTLLPLPPQATSAMFVILSSPPPPPHADSAAGCAC